MKSLEKITEQAIQWHSKPLTRNEKEVGRIMQICNACRYCEGFCAVFPAMTQRLTFGSKADLHYLANLCHNCGACLHACQYAPPHDFGVNVPQAMAKVRKETYTEYAWPSAFGKLYDRNGLVVSLAIGLCLSLFLLMALFVKGTLWHAPLNGNFYAVFPHNTLVLMFGTVFTLAIFALGLGVVRFWRNVSPGNATRPAIAEAITDALRLKYLDGGHGLGCNDEDDRFTQRRRIFHHLTFYGFMLCFAATTVATFYHYFLGLQAPYEHTSLPVVLGTVGGIGLLIGPAGLFFLHARRAKLQLDPEQVGMDRGFIGILFLVSLTGFWLLIWRDTSAMAMLLAIHLGVVMAFFLTLPYSKFAHGVYRSAALLKWAVEKRKTGGSQPTK